LGAKYKKVEENKVQNIREKGRKGKKKRKREVKG
jgi:hypothetical protein